MDAGPSPQASDSALYIVERIVNAHGGSITVASTPEDGTTFEVRLPHRRISDRDGVDRRAIPTD